MSATNRRKAAQEELREKLKADNHLGKAIDILEQMTADDMDPKDVAMLEKVFNGRMRLVDKYLPNLKAIEISGDPENPLSVESYGLSDTERAARIAAILNTARERAPGSTTNGRGADMVATARTTESSSS